jgi:hypothetical protein
VSEKEGGVDTPVCNTSDIIACEKVGTLGRRRRRREFNQRWVPQGAAPPAIR